jgi:hypothetical protein
MVGFDGELRLHRPELVIRSNSNLESRHLQKRVLSLSLQKCLFQDPVKVLIPSSNTLKLDDLRLYPFVNASLR